MSRKFTLIREKRKLTSLKKHKLVDEMGYLKPSDLHVSFLEEYGMYKLPIVVDDFYISLPELIEAAIQAAIQEVEVWVINGATIIDLLKIINFENLPWYKASKVVLFKSIKTLEHYLWNTTEGQTWRDSLPGDDINEVIGNLVGYSGSTISLVKYVGNKDYTLLDQVDDPDVDMTLTRAKMIIQAQEKVNEKKDNYADFFDTNMEQGEEEDNEDEVDGDSVDGQGGADTATIGSVTDSKVTSSKGPKKTASKPKKEPCDAIVTSFSLGLGKYGDFELDLNGNTAAVLMNGRFVGHINITADEKNHLDEGLHFVLQNADEGWSFHLIATRISKLLKKQEVGCNRA